jgi:hypothetical protein
LSDKFGAKVQKVSINAGFSCPNLDGTISDKGCIYCNNNGFIPDYCSPEIPIEKQIDEGIKFFSRKCDYLYLAYFQPFTNTHTLPEKLRTTLLKAAKHDKIVGIIVSTRPDCVPEKIIDVLKEVSAIKEVMLEFGVESTDNNTLEFLNRGHTYAQVCATVENCSKAGLEVGVHLILGLPNENRKQILNHAKIISQLPIRSVKLHQLQIVKNTRLSELYEQNPEKINLINLSDYVDLCCDFVELLRPDIAIERFASIMPPRLLTVQNWGGVKNHHITHLVQKKLTERGSVQGNKWGAISGNHLN